MGIANNVGEVMRLFGKDGEYPLAVLRCRSVLATRHAVAAGSEWCWSPQPADGEELAALLLPVAPLLIRSADGTEHEALPGTMYFFHPHRSTRIAFTTPSIVVCAWVPWSALKEIETGMHAPGERIGVSALGRGMRAFLSSLFAPPSEQTLYTDHVLERLIAEMVFGVLVEAAPRMQAERKEQWGIDRARTLMLMRRSDRDFDVAALAREMHVSVRQLQRLFATQQSSPAGELRGLRVDLARELMGNPECARLGMDEIAAHSGFRDGAALRRAFALAGLPSPREVRKHKAH